MTKKNYENDDEDINKLSDNLNTNLNIKDVDKLKYSTRTKESPQKLSKSEILLQRPEITIQKLSKAIVIGNIENIKKFIHDNGTDLNFTTVKDGTNPFVHASALNKIELVKFFSSEVDIKIDVTDAFGNTALMKASEKGYIEIAEYLINNGASVNFQNKEGVSPLMVAAEKNNFYVFKLLIDKKADTSKSDYTGRTIREIAENSRDKRILKLLN